ncbi:MAG: hypothetical protein AAF226_15440 [Verrucomicrobiota bacterium]
MSDSIPQRHLISIPSLTKAEAASVALDEAGIPFHKVARDMAGQALDSNDGAPAVWEFTVAESDYAEARTLLDAHPLDLEATQERSNMPHPVVLLGLATVLAMALYAIVMLFFQ